MRIRHTLYLAALLLSNLASAQRLEIISMEHFGGEKGETIAIPPITIYPNGDFSININTLSTSGNILTSCTEAIIGGGVMRRYDNSFNALLGETCAPKGTGFKFYTFYIYPQSNGDTILIGERDTAGQPQDVAIERRDASGNVLWTKYYGGNGSDGLGGVAPAPGDGFYVVAATNSTDGDVGFHYGSTFTADTWVLRLDNNGDIVWSKVIGGTESDLVREVHPAEDGGCYIFGVTTSDDYDATGNHGSSDLHVVKLDSNGSKEWHRCYGGSDDDGSGYDLGIKALPDGQGGFYVLNRTASKDGDVQLRLPADEWWDFWLLHIDSTGAILWENTYGGPNYQYPTAFCRGTDGSLWLGGENAHNAVGGQIDAAYGSTDCWVVHTDSLGQFLGQRVLGGNQADALNMLHALPDGTVLAGGRYRTNNGDRSPGFPAVAEGTDGAGDIFLAHIGPNTVGINDKEDALPGWTLYPNPAGKQVAVQVNVPGKYRLTVASVDGQKIYSAKLKDTLTLDTRTWAPGLYLVTLSSPKGSSVRKLLIRQ